MLRATLLFVLVKIASSTPLQLMTFILPLLAATSAQVTTCMNLMTAYEPCCDATVPTSITPSCPVDCITDPFAEMLAPLNRSFMYAVIKHDHNNIGGTCGSFNYTCAPLDTETVALFEQIKDHVNQNVNGSNFEFVYDIPNNIRYEIYNVHSGDMQMNVLNAFLEALHTFGSRISVIREANYYASGEFGSQANFKQYSESLESAREFSLLSSNTQTFLNNNFVWAMEVFGSSSVQDWWDTVVTYKLFVQRTAMNDHVLIKYH